MGLQPNKLNSVANSNYLPAPTTTATTLDITNAPNATANNYTISIGARADFSMLSTDYSNTFTITAVANLIQYNIAYASNTTDTVTNMPSTQADTATTTSITLSANAPVREGYNFIGWNTAANGSGITFNPGATYGIDKTISNNITLYAMWEKNVIYMQDFTLAQCSTAAVDSAIEVVDKRDDQVYTVRYLEGNCWMTSNLNYDLATKNTLDPSTSNVASAKTLSNVSTTAAFSTSGAGYTTPNIRVSTTVGYGTYYNYCAATAGEICESSSTVEAAESVCPAGWRLPTGYNTATVNGATVNGEQKTLTAGTWQTWNTTYGKDSAFSPVAAGYYSDSSLFDAGSRGYWWSSTAYNGTHRYNLRYSTSNGLRSGDGSSRYFGYSVRCVRAS